MSDIMVANRGPELRAVCATYISLAVSAVLLRLYVRLRLVRAFGWDDVWMVVALSFLIMFTITAINGTYWGTGRHMADLDEEHIKKALKFWYLCYPAYCLCMVSAKISIGIFLLRVAVQRIYRRIIYTVLGLTVFTGLLFFFVTVVQCNPINFFWDKFQTTGTCLPIDVIIGLAYAYSIVAAICDFTFGTLPIFLVWNLNMAKNQKLMLIPILSMACVASIAVTVRMGYLMKLKSENFLWDTVEIAIWSDIEQGLAITAGSLATLRPLYRQLSKRLGWSDVGTHTPLPNSEARRGSHGWYRTRSTNQRKRNGPFSLLTMTRAGEEETRKCGSSDEELVPDVERPMPIKLRDDLVEERNREKGFSMWEIQVGDRSDENLTDAQGIKRQRDVFLESSSDHR